MAETTGVLVESFDLIVLGAGPAGAAAACTAARMGLSVALVDKAAFPRDKLCGGGVSGRSAAYLREIFALDPVERGDLFLSSQRYVLTERGRELARYDDAPTVHLTMRHAFDAALVAQAQSAGAELFAPARVLAMDLAEPALTLEDGRILRAGVMIGADGTNSAVARALFGRAFDPARVAFAMEVELPPATSDLVEIDLAAAAWGYGWVFPKHASRTVGVGGIQGRNPDMRACLDAYLNQSATLGPGPRPEARVKGAFLPSGEFRAIPGRGAVLLAGDAAGLVDPLTGEGIAWALESGRLAALAAAEALATGDALRALPLYRAALAPVHREMRAARRIRALVYARPFARLFTRVLARYPRLGDSYLRLFSGERDYADIGPARIARLLWLMARAQMSSAQRR